MKEDCATIHAERVHRSSFGPVNLRREERNARERLEAFSASNLRGDPRIITAKGGGPLRTIINGRQVRMTGRFPSIKAGRSIPYEADHEYALIEHCDVDKAVIGCMSQPHRVEIPVPWQGRPLIYFPDLRRDLADGSVEIIETKQDNDRRLMEPDYAFKLGCVRLLYESLGWKFRILEKAEIMGGRRYANVHDIVAWANAKIDPRRQVLLEAAIDEAGGVLEYGKAAKIAGGVPILSSLMVRRRIHFCLKSKIDDELPVMRVDHEALRRSSPTIL